MAGVAEYSGTAASNTTINSIGIAGTNNVQNFDNALRQLMADIANARLDGQMAAMPYATKSSGYTVAVTDRGKLIDCTAAVELELPVAATAGAAFYFIAKANGGAVTLDPNGSEDINGASTSVVIADGSSALVVCDGTEWYTITIGAGNVTTDGTQTLINKTIILKQGASEAPTAEGDVRWDTDDNRLVIGDGAATQTFTPNPASTAAGDVEYYTAANVKARLAKGTSLQVIRMKTDATVPEWGNPRPLLHIQDQKASNTAGGTFTSGDWRTRTLNTEVTDEITSTLSSNQFTLPAGTYEIDASAPGFGCGHHQAKLRNVTDGSDTLLGTSADTDTTNLVLSRSHITGRFTIADAKTFEIHHRCSDTQATNGFGAASAFAVIEIYTDVRIWRVA